MDSNSRSGRVSAPAEEQAMEQCLSDMQLKFTAIIVQMKGKPEVFVRFMSWLDVRLTEYKNSGIIRLHVGYQLEDTSPLDGSREKEKIVPSKCFQNMCVGMKDSVPPQTQKEGSSPLLRLFLSSNNTEPPTKADVRLPQTVLPDPQKSVSLLQKGVPATQKSVLLPQTVVRAPQKSMSTQTPITVPKKRACLKQTTVPASQRTVSTQTLVTAPGESAHLKQPVVRVPQRSAPLENAAVSQESATIRKTVVLVRQRSAPLQNAAVTVPQKGATLQAVSNPFDISLLQTGVSVQHHQQTTPSCLKQVDKSLSTHAAKSFFTKPTDSLPAESSRQHSTLATASRPDQPSLEPCASQTREPVLPQAMESGPAKISETSVPLETDTINSLSSQKQPTDSVPAQKETTAALPRETTPFLSPQAGLPLPRKTADFLPKEKLQAVLNHLASLPKSDSPESEITLLVPLTDSTQLSEDSGSKSTPVPPPKIIVVHPLGSDHKKSVRPLMSSSKAGKALHPPKKKFSDRLPRPFIPCRGNTLTVTSSGLKPKTKGNVSSLSFPPGSKRPASNEAVSLDPSSATKRPRMATPNSKGCTYIQQPMEVVENILMPKKCSHKLFTQEAEESIVVRLLKLREQHRLINPQTFRNCAVRQLKKLGKQVAKLPKRSNFSQRLLKTYKALLQGRAAEENLLLPGGLENKIRRFYARLHKLQQRHEFEPKHIINMDEVQVFFSNPNTTFPSYLQKNFGDVVPQTSNANLKCTSAKVLIAVTASGDSLTPYVFFKGKKWPNCLKPSVANIPVGLFEQGGMSEDVMMDWIERVLQPYVLRAGSKPTLLVMDSLGAHRGVRVKEALADLGVTPAYIPLGCTSKVQPIDLSVKKSFKTELDEMWWHHIDPVTKHKTLSFHDFKSHKSCILTWISESWLRVMSCPSMIQRAFCEAGIIGALANGAGEVSKGTDPGRGSESKEDSSEVIQGEEETPENEFGLTQEGDGEADEFSYARTEHCYSKVGDAGLYADFAEFEKELDDDSVTVLREVNELSRDQVEQANVSGHSEESSDSGKEGTEIVS